MIKEKQQLFRRLSMFLDMLVVAIAFFLAYILRQNVQGLCFFDFFPEKEITVRLHSLSRYLNILPLSLFAWWVMLRLFGLYESLRRQSFLKVTCRIMKSAFFVMLIVVSAVFALNMDYVSRSFMFVLFFLTSALLILERWGIVLFLKFLRRKGYNYRNILVVGTGSRARNFIKLVQKHNEWGLRIIGLIDTEKKRLGRTVCGRRVIGLLDDIPEILKKKVVDEVIFIVPRKWLSIIEKSLIACETQGVRTNIAADFFNMKIAQRISTDIEGIPLLGFKTTVGEEWQLLLKRLFDIIFSLIAAILALPIFVATAVIIKLFCGSPVIFKQTRSSLNGREFVMYKFRTMVNGAEHKKKKLSSFNEMDGPVFKMHNDPRVTRLGIFLRRTSLDELPQLFNVLKGDMSIIGPRPPVPMEVAKYEVWQRRRLSMKPGLTCLWQINGRNNVDFKKWMKMDLEYMDNWSLALDFKILLKTIPAVLFSKGAR